MLEYRKMITRNILQDEPNTIFVFGDNLARRGMGGQAREMRGEPNAIGIPTKRLPSMKDEAFLGDDDFQLWFDLSYNDITYLIGHDGLIVWPSDGIGTGRAKLESKSPKIWGAIELLRMIL